MRTVSAWMRVPLGVVIGLFASVIVLAVIQWSTARTEALPSTLMSDCDGAIGEIVIHYVSEAGDMVEDAYREFLRQLSRDVVVQVVCPDRSDFDDLGTRIGTTRCRLTPVIVGHPMTTWSRDRWLALQRAGGGLTTLLGPRSEKSEEWWPQRAGDAQVGWDLACALGNRIAFRRSSLYFDGGDFVADTHCVFVTPDVALRNLQQTVKTHAELLTHLESAFNRQVVLLEDAPPYHAGMFMMTLGERTVMVGDPAAARRILPEPIAQQALGTCLPIEADFSDATIAKFDRVADQCRATGYRVIRVPVVPGRDGRTYLSYVNVIIDQHREKRIVYMPVYAGAELVNHAAAGVWASAGYEVRPVDCTACYRHYGSLRCLVNVMSRN